MGLLDFLNGGNDIVDPAMADKVAGMKPSELDGLLRQVAPGSDQKSAAIRKGLLQAGLSIMSAKTGGNLAAAIGQGGQQGLQTYDASMDQSKKDNLMGMQLQRQGVSDSQDAAKFDAWQKGNQTATADAQAMKDLGAKYYNPASGQFDEKGYIEELWKLNPTAAMQYTEKMKDRTASQSPYFTPFMTSTGIGILNARTGGVDWPTAPAATPGGAPTAPRLLPVAADPTVQGAVAGAKTTAEGDAKAVLSAKAGEQKTAQMNATYDTVEKLLPIATNSGIGAGADTVNRMFGRTTESAKAASQLETLAGWMTANVPRMEGPQSDADVNNYRIMAARVGDRTIPYEERLQALQVLKDLQTKYANLNTDIVSSGNAPIQTDKPARVFKVLR